MTEDKSAEGQARTLTRRAGLVAAGTLSSRLLGAVRDAVIAASFSIASTDAFFVAWTVPNTLRRLLGEGAVSAAFIPVFAEIDERKGRTDARRYFADFLGAIGIVLVATGTVGMLTARLWATLYAAGYRDSPAKFETTVELLTLCFPYIVFAGIAALLTGVLNALGRFLVPAFAPALLNITLIAAPFLFVPLAVSVGRPPITGLAIAALVGGALQVLAQLPSLRRVGMATRPRLGFDSAAVRRSFALMLPLLLGTGVHQINILLSRLFASFLPGGAQSYLYYGQRLVEIPQGMFAVAIASAALPSLARLRNQGAHEEALSTLRFSLRLSLFIALPASAALATLALPVTTVLFGRGAFTPGDAVQTARSLVWLALGVWAVAAAQPVVRMYYAYNDTRTPVLCSAANLMCFAAGSLIYMPSYGHVAIAGASSAGAMAQLVLLVVLLRKRVGKLSLGEVAVTVLKAGAASAVMAWVIRDIATLGDWTRGGNDPTNAGALALSVAFGLAVYAAASYLLKADELQVIAGSLVRRANKANP